MIRMDHSTFCTILRYIEKDITPNGVASGIKVIRAPERLVLTIRYFATGETFRSLSFQFRVSRRAISSIVVQVSLICDITFHSLKIAMHGLKLLLTLKISGTFQMV